MGSAPRHERWCTRALGFNPCVRTAASDATSTAEAASEIWLDTAAVSRPPSTNVRRDAILARSGSRGPSSRVTPASGTISRSKRPSSVARRARGGASAGYASMSSREIAHFSAMSSAPRNCDTSWSPYRARQPSDPENGSVNPNCSATVMADAIGIMLMFCTPPATMKSLVPLITAWAAKCSACCDDPHWRSIVVPGTSSGIPAASHAVRAMSPAWGPMASTHPRNTSSTASGSTSLRSNSARITWAPRSAGCTARRPPPRRPTGVRTASMRYASARSDTRDHRRSVTEQALVDGEPDACPLDLAAGRLSPQLPGELAHLGDGLGGDRLAEARQPTAGVHRDASADGGVTVVEEALGLALLAEADVLVPVELQRRREVVHLGQVEVVGPDARLRVCGVGDRVAERRLGQGHAARGVGCEVRHLDDRV